MDLDFSFNRLAIFCVSSQPTINRIEDINAAEYPHEKTIYYCIAMASFGAILDVVICIYSIVNNNGFNKQTIEMLFGGVVIGILAGWTTCLPLLL